MRAACVATYVCSVFSLCLYVSTSACLYVCLYVPHFCVPYERESAANCVNACETYIRCVLNAVQMLIASVEADVFELTHGACFLVTKKPFWLTMMFVLHCVAWFFMFSAKTMLELPPPLVFHNLKSFARMYGELKQPVSFSLNWHGRVYCVGPIVSNGNC